MSRGSIPQSTIENSAAFSNSQISPERSEDLSLESQSYLAMQHQKTDSGPHTSGHAGQRTECMHSVQNAHVQIFFSESPAKSAVKLECTKALGHSSRKPSLWSDKSIRGCSPDHQVYGQRFPQPNLHIQPGILYCYYLYQSLQLLLLQDASLHAPYPRRLRSPHRCWPSPRSQRGTSAPCPARASRWSTL